MAHLLHVYGVKDNSCKDDLRKIFSRCGKVVGVDKLGKGAALVGYKEKAEAEDAISTLQFTSFNGKVLEIKKSTLFTQEHFSTVKEKNYGFCLREFICYNYNVYECANAAGGGQCLRGKHYCFYCFLNGRGHLAHRNRDPDCPSRQRGWEDLPQHKSAEERLTRVGQGQVMQTVAVNNQDSGRVVVPGPLRGRFVSGQAAPGGQGLVVGQCVVQGQRVMAGQRIVTAGGQSMVVSASGQTMVLPAGAQQVMAGGIRQVVHGGTRGGPSTSGDSVSSEAQSHQRPSPIGDPDTVPSQAQSTQNPSQSQKEQQVLSSSRLSEQPPIGNGAVQSSLNLELDQLGDRRSMTNKENLKKIIANKRKLDFPHHPIFDHNDRESVLSMEIPSTGPQSLRSECNTDTGSQDGSESRWAELSQGAWGAQEGAWHLAQDQASDSEEDTPTPGATPLSSPFRQAGVAVTDTGAGQETPLRCVDMVYQRSTLTNTVS